MHTILAKCLMIRSKQTTLTNAWKNAIRPALVCFGITNLVFADYAPTVGMVKKLPQGLHTDQKIVTLVCISASKLKVSKFINNSRV